MKPIHTIAVGFDGSADSKVAVRWALTLARHYDAHVVVAHAVGLLGRFDAKNVAVELEESLLALCDECGLEHARARLEIADGDACSVMLRMAEPPISADLLVVGTRGQGAHAGLLLGSTSLELAEHSPIPLVIVPSS
ncbi:MAG: universal stress protein [Acidimicrobiales bacterium]|jgi:nucleotide-binding universal stress UspA family protein